MKQCERTYNEWQQRVQPEERSEEFFAAVHGLITPAGVYYAKVDYAKHKERLRIPCQTCHRFQSRNPWHTQEMQEGAQTVGS